MLDNRSKQLRRKIVETLRISGKGHLGAAFSLVEILRVLYDEVLSYDSRRPNYSLRDRCILSKGHGCLALYTILAEKGFFPEEELKKFCQPESLLGGHPEHTIPGIETSTGSLGHGLSIGVGIALNERFEKSGYKTFVIIGDGESNEGSIWEAALCAGKYKLNNLTVIIDYNKQQSYGTTKEVQDMEPFADKWEAFGFNVEEIDGHNIDRLRTTFKTESLTKPKAIISNFRELTELLV